MSPSTSALYTLAMEYFATGEGMTVWVMVVRASNELAARERFWTVFFGPDPLARSYYGPGLDVTVGLDRVRLRGHEGAFLDRLETTARSAGAFEFSSRLHFNLS